MLESVQPVLMSSDVRTSCRFYERLGFATVFRDVPAEPKYAAVVHDVDALFAEFKSSGVINEATTGQGPWRVPGETPWGTREFHLHDPDGNGLQFYRAL